MCTPLSLPHCTFTLLLSNFLPSFSIEGQRGVLSVFVQMQVCQHVEMGFNLTALSSCEFPSSLSFPLAVQQLGF